MYKSCFYVLFLAFLLVFSGILQSICAQETRLLQGRYYGENVFLSNPLYKDYSTFCIQEVVLNGKILLKEPKISALEVKLGHLPLKTEISIRITHRPQCSFRVINPEALSIVGQATFTHLYTEENKLFWRVKHAEPDARYIIKRLNSDDWEEDGSISAHPDSAIYTYRPKKLYAGVNKFRIKYVSSTFTRHSTDVEILLKETIITFTPYRVKDHIMLSERTYFEVLSSEQKVLLSGETQRIPLRRLRPGSYFILLKGKAYPFIKR